MAELIRLKVDLIIAGGNPATAAAKKATTTIPIVGGSLSYPVEAGLVTSFARPGANITGLALYAELNAKQLEVVKEIISKGSSDRWAAVRGGASIDRDAGPQRA